MTITEETLECSACPWRGVEADAALRTLGDGEDDVYVCPACGEDAAHFPLDELGNEIADYMRGMSA